MITDVELNFANSLTEGEPDTVAALEFHAKLPEPSFDRDPLPWIAGNAMV